MLAATAAAQVSETEALVKQGRAALGSWERWGEARTCFEKALLIKRKDWWFPFAGIGLAVLARAEGNVDDALQRLSKVESSIAKWPPEVLVKMARAEIKEEQGRSFLALGVLDRAALAFEAFEAQADRNTLVGCWLVYLAKIDLLLAQERGRKAWQLLQRAEADFQAMAAKGRDSAVKVTDLQRCRHTMRAKLPISVLLAMVGQEMAISVVELDLQKCRRTVRAQLPLACEERMALALESERAFLEAEPGNPVRTRAGLDAVEAWMAVGDLDHAWQCSNALLKPPFETLQREAEIRAQNVRLAMRHGRPAEEVAAARATLDAVAMRLFAKWREAPIRAGGVGSFYYSARRDILGALLEADRQVLSPGSVSAAALAHIETAFSLGSLTRRFGGRMPDLAAVRRELMPPGGGIMAFVFAPHSAHLLLIDAAGSDLVSLPIQPGYLQQLREYHDQIDRPPADGSAESLRANRQLGLDLASQLFPPAVQERLRAWQGLLLVGDENSVAAWQALPIAGSWLGVEMAIAHVPSFSLACALQQRMAARAPHVEGGLDLAIVGDPAITAATATRWGVDSLSLGEEQRHSLLGGYAADRVHAFWGRDATPDQFAAVPVQSARALCVVTHGVEDFGRERFAGIVLSAATPEQAVLFADGVEAIAVPPLVLLGVCHAASGPQRIGEDGVQHLGGAFLWSGADSVVLASGQVSLGATIDLLGACVDRVRCGDGAAEALRRGRQLIANDPERAHPFYFAGLRLSGLGGFVPR